MADGGLPGVDVATAAELAHKSGPPDTGGP